MRNWLLLVIFCVLLFGCGEDSVGVTPTISLPIPTVAPTIDNPLPQLTIESEAPRFELRVWVPPTISADSSPDPLNPNNPLPAQIEAFVTTHAEAAITLQTKSFSEQGGILSYLRTGRNVAPGILPDLIALPADQLERAVQEGLVYPLDGLVDTDSMLPVGRELGQIDGIQYAAPFLITDFYHLVYNPNVITDIFARRWADFSTLERASLILPANGQAGVTLLLQLYRGANGSLADGEGAFQFQVPPLTEALNDIQRGVDDGYLRPESATFSNAADAWSFFQSGSATILLVNAETFLAQRAQGNGSSFAPLPTSRTSTSPVVHGWVWAITTPNIERQAISAELITHLIEPQNLGAYSVALQIPPASEDAFDAWQLNEYTTFLKTQLAVAVAYPDRLTVNSVNAMTNALTRLIKQEITVEDAILQINAVANP